MSYEEIKPIKYVHKRLAVGLGALFMPKKGTKYREGKQWTTGKEASSPQYPGSYLTPRQRSGGYRALQPIGADGAGMAAHHKKVLDKRGGI